MSGRKSPQGGDTGNQSIYDGTRRLGSIGKTPFGQWWARGNDGADLGYFPDHATAARAVHEAAKKQRPSP